VSANNNNAGHISYVQQDIRKYRGINNVDDYLRIRSSVERSVPDAKWTGRLSEKWKSFSKSNGFAVITALGTVIIAIAAVATLVVMLL
jgi:hypothetical protein